MHAIGSTDFLVFVLVLVLHFLLLRTSAWDVSDLPPLDLPPPLDLSNPPNPHPPPHPHPPHPHPAVDGVFPDRYRRSKKEESPDDEFDSKKQTYKWVNEDLKTLDKYALQKCWGGVDPVERVFGYDIWFNEGKSQKVGDKLCLYDNFEHPKDYCKEVFCDRGYDYCVLIRGFNAYHKKKMTVVGCSKDSAEQCYLEGKGQKKGDTYHHMLGGPIGDVWNTPGYEKDLTACQCQSVMKEKRQEVNEPCNGDCVKYVQTCHGEGHH